MVNHAKYIVALSVTALIGLVVLVQLNNRTSGIHPIFPESSALQTALASNPNNTDIPNQTESPTNFLLNITSDNIIHLSWNVPSNASTFPPTGYIVHDGHSPVTVDTTTYIYPSTIVAGTSYCFTVESVYTGNVYSIPTEPVCGSLPDDTSQNNNNTQPDLCPNIDGIQNPIPNGMTKDSVGNCSVPQVNNTVLCTNYSYSDWGICAGGMQTRNNIGKIPANCSGVPSAALVTSQTCTIGNVSDDTTPPIVSSASPSGILAYTTTNATLTVTTNENATCKYSATPGTAFLNMANTFTITGVRNHSSALSSLVSGSFYIYYVRCKDIYSNVSQVDYPVFFSVAANPITSNQNDYIDYGNWFNNQGSNNPPPPPVVDWTLYSQNYDYGSTHSSSGNTTSHSPTPSRSTLSSRQVNTAPPSPLVVTKNLKLNDRSSEALLLQRTLNHLGYTVADSGPGSLGQETSIFDDQTMQALIRYQESYSQSGVVPNGMLDNTTILLLNSDIARLANQELTGTSTPSPARSVGDEQKYSSRANSLIGSKIDWLVNLLMNIFK